MMEVYVGIDLGSTTTKAIVLDEGGHVIGQGITNSRSNYNIASKVVREEAFVRTRFTITRQNAMRAVSDAGLTLEADFFPAIERNFRMRQYLEQLAALHDAMFQVAETARHKAYADDLKSRLGEMCGRMRDQARVHFAPGAVRKSDFFRDLAGADYMGLAESMADPKGISFDTLCGVFDSAILAVENISFEGAFVRHIGVALDDTLLEAPPDIRRFGDRLRAAVESARLLHLNESGTAGTGYGRQRLPFPKDQIRSEILCHGLGAHVMFPATRTVLDIGGQDTKAIQLDSEGLVTSFQMNDRCAAGCGRYLGYIADEMNLALHELGPLAQQSRQRVKINSTCTVFAGAELRERLSLGQSREDILAGLHRAIILRAMSLLARSGGVRDEFTFTGGVAKNPAAVAALQDLVSENYGKLTINTSPDSIYTGALGAALFALRAAERKAA
jgi:benzoyl-CoA reductase subunit A